MSAADTHMDVWRAEQASEQDAGMAAWLAWHERLRKALKASEREMDGELLERAHDLFCARVSVERATAELQPILVRQGMEHRP